jgi:hypothetical protein
MNTQSAVNCTNVLNKIIETTSLVFGGMSQIPQTTWRSIAIGQVQNNGIYLPSLEERFGICVSDCVGLKRTNAEKKLIKAVSSALEVLVGGF